MSDTVDTPENLTLLCDRLIDCEWERLSPELIAASTTVISRYAALLEQVAEHKQRCAGEWVPVGERPPPENIYIPVVVLDDEDIPVLSSDAFDPDEGWHSGMFERPTHFLDARLPGGEE